MKRRRLCLKKNKAFRIDRRVPYLKALFESVDVGLCLLDGKGRVVATNGAMRRMFPGDFVPGASGLRSLGREEGVCGSCPTGQGLACGSPVARRAEIVGADGKARQVETMCHPLRQPDGRLFGLAEIARDVSRRVTAEREMALAGQDIEMLLGSIRSILVSLDGEDRIRRFNVSAEEVLGLAAKDVLDRDFFDIGLVWDGPSVGEAVAASRRTLLPVRIDEISCRVPGHGERLLGLTVNPVPGPGGASPGVLILGQDLSGIKVRELKADHERRMQAIGRLASGIAHEINTPLQYVGYNIGFLDEAFGDILSLLTAYAGLADMAASGPGQSLPAAVATAKAVEADVDIAYLRQEIPEALANSRKGVRQVSDIVAAMRQMSHPGTGESLFFDLNASVRDTVTITRNAWKHVAAVELDLAPDLPFVYGQPHEVSQVLLNVVLNAAQAVEERAIREPWLHGRIGIATAAGPDGVSVTVSDNGPGIDPAVAGRIFDPFFTTKAVGKGTGQGLAISQAIMVRHGGGIEFSSRPQEGSVFCIRFPAEGADGAR